MTIVKYIEQKTGLVGDTPMGICSDGNYIYAASDSGSTTYLYRLDLDTLEILDKLNLNGMHVNSIAIIDNMAYMSCAYPIGLIVKVDLDQFVIDSTYTVPGSNFVIVTDGVALYVGFGGVPAVVIKYDTSLNQLAIWTGTHGESTAYSLLYNNGYIYVGTDSYYPTYVVKLNQDLVQVAEWESSAADGGSDALTCDDTYLYVGLWLSEVVIKKLKLSTLEEVGSLNLPGFSSMYGIGYRNGKLCVGTDNDTTTFGLIGVIDAATLTLLETVPLSGSVNYLITQLVFDTFGAIVSVYDIASTENDEFVMLGYVDKYPLGLTTNPFTLTVTGLAKVTQFKVTPWALYRE